MDYSPPGSSVHGIPGKNTGVGCHALLQGIFKTQSLNPGLLHCRHILYHLSHQGNPVLMIEQVKEIMRWWCVFGNLLSSLPTASVVEQIDFSCLFYAPNKICCHGGHASEGGSCLLCIYLPFPPAHRLGLPGKLRLGMMALAASPCCSGTSFWALHSHLAVPSF